MSYVKQIAAALQYAHNQRVVHRDIKPENMLLGTDKQVLLSDFGIAVVVQSTRHPNLESVVGTAAYMSPEQFSGKSKPASDQYALGIVVYEWLTGERPFHGAFAELASQHMFIDPPSLREKLPSISSAIEEVVFRALEKDPEARYESVQDFADALEEVCTNPLPQPRSRSPVILNPPTPPLRRSVPASPQQRRGRPAASPVPHRIVPPVPRPIPRRSDPPSRLPLSRRAHPIEPDDDDEGVLPPILPARRIGGPPLPPLRRANPIEFDDDDEDVPPVLPARRIIAIPRSPLRQASPQRNKSRREVHWLIPLGVGLIATLIVWLIAPFLIDWGVTRYDDFLYGYPRTFQADAVVGHNEDTSKRPSHFIAINLSGQLLVFELPADDPTHTISYSGPRLVGAGTDLTLLRSVM